MLHSVLEMLFSRVTMSELYKSSLENPYLISIYNFQIPGEQQAILGALWNKT